MRVIVVFTLLFCLLWGVSGGGSSGGNVPLQPAEKIFPAPRVNPPILVESAKPWPSFFQREKRPRFLGMKLELPISKVVKHLNKEFDQ